MYRLIIFTSLFILGECCFPKFPTAPCHWREGDVDAQHFEIEARAYFEETADYLHKIDSVSNMFCYMFGENEMQVHNRDSYKLLVAAPEGSGPYQVSLRHTVLFVRGSGTGCSSLSHMKILPPYVDVSRLSWRHENNTIVVSVPYSRTETGYKKCPFTKETLQEKLSVRKGDEQGGFRPVYIDETKV